MPSTAHTLKTTSPHGCDDVEVEIGFRFTPGYLGDRLDPPCPDEAEITSVFIIDADGSKRPALATMIQVMSTSDRLYFEMIDYAKGECQPDPDAAQDHAAEAVLP